MTYKRVVQFRLVSSRFLMHCALISAPFTSFLRRHESRKGGRNEERSVRDVPHTSQACQRSHVIAHTLCKTPHSVRHCENLLRAERDTSDEAIQGRPTM